MDPLNAMKLHMEDAPAWYDLEPLENGLRVSIHPAEYAAMLAFLKDQVAAGDYGQSLNVGPFIPFDQPACGFGSAAVTGASDGRGWKMIDCEFPKTPRNGKFDWNRLYAVSGTLQTIFSGLNMGGNETREQSHQCLAVNLYTRISMMGGGIDAKLSPTTARWIKTIDEQPFRLINATMARLGVRLFGENFAEPREFNMYLRSDGAPIFNCFGDACDLGPCGDNDEPGCELEPHNTDSPMQQLSLLSGLAALNQAAREAGL